ncbi:hypothetical protein A9Q96_00470 [Rhodobacterales bacterium 52_120_T64]|nr:hypothetical protein A9Q96_00470 [Rhodobacterales bacterium 52_120_T64]
MLTYAKRRFIAKSATYLMGHQNRSGKFIYRVRTDGKAVRKDYNVLRHAGAIYALNQSRSFTEPQIQNSIDRALSYLWRWYLIPVEAQKLRFAIASSRPGKKNSDIVKLGGISLAQIALATQQRNRSVFEDDVAHGLARFTRSMVGADGSVTSKLNVRTEEVSDFASLYYPGEAALSLLLYAMEYKDEDSIQCSLSILQHLCNTRKDLPSVPPDHWALLATAEVLSLNSTGRIDVEDTALAALHFHAAQVVDKILRDADLADDSAGSLTDNGQTCSSATRLEGLCAIFPHMKKNGYPNLDQIQDCIERGIGYLMSAQVESGPLAGGMPWVSPHHTTYATNQTAPEIRIDSVQHAISAVLGSLSLDYNK